MARRALVPLLGVLAVLAAGCGGGGQATTTTTTTTAAAAPAKTGTVWLCFPGKTPDPCSSSMATTVIKANGSRTVETPKAPASPPIDCFYVYPTVSSENQGNSDLQIQLPQIFVAQAQASRFSQVCRVYAPMYRQITDRGLTTALPAREPAPDLHLSPLAWQDYLAHYNHGRGVVLIGHSQGAYVLKQLDEARDRLDARAAAADRVGDPARRPGAAARTGRPTPATSSTSRPAHPRRPPAA